MSLNLFASALSFSLFLLPASESRDFDFSTTNRADLAYERMATRVAPLDRIDLRDRASDTCRGRERLENRLNRDFADDRFDRNSSDRDRPDRGNIKSGRTDRDRTIADRFERDQVSVRDQANEMSA